MKNKYIVSGMTCGRCAAHVTEEVQELEGVTGVNVEWESGEMIIESEVRIPYDAVVGAVAEAGDYTVVEA
ncbi:MAG: cation transporter [Propionibacteriaceae bacterium]|nr:cation transporter [Propionibacteriaceae bacterium]